MTPLLGAPSGRPFVIDPILLTDGDETPPSW
jgi:hypothetical protein